jgi:outer membrane lipoprotein LolB
MGKSCAALAAAAALAACATLEPARGPAPRAAAFDLIGRVAVTYDGRVFSSTVRWEHTAERDEIWLLTPAGQGLAHITGEADGAVYTGADRRQYRAGDIQSLTRRVLGWELPIAHLSWWVQGELAPGAVSDRVERDHHGRLTALAQEGWRIAYVHYPPSEQAGRPRRLELKGEAQEIRLVIDGWRRNESGQ